VTARHRSRHSRYHSALLAAGLTVALVAAVERDQLRAREAAGASCDASTAPAHAQHCRSLPGLRRL
jgi:hypothetical protein